MGKSEQKRRLFKALDESSRDKRGEKKELTNKQMRRELAKIEEQLKALAKTDESISANAKIEERINALTKKH